MAAVRQGRFSALRLTLYHSVVFPRSPLKRAGGTDDDETQP